MSDLVNEIKKLSPDILTRPIQKWDDMLINNLTPFIKEKYWHDSTSVNVFRVVGTEHPDYIGLSWIELLQKGKRMPINLSLFEQNPDYYISTDKKQPSMYLKSIDGGDLYIGGDGNHRTCIAKAAFFLKGQSILHGLTLEDYRIDWNLKNIYNELQSLIERQNFPLKVEAYREVVSRDDSGGWMIEKYNTLLKLTFCKTGKTVSYDAHSAKQLLDFCKDNRVKSKLMKFLGRWVVMNI